jgi:hypothetical protein
MKYPNQQVQLVGTNRFLSPSYKKWYADIIHELSNGNNISFDDFNNYYHPHDLITKLIQKKSNSTISLTKITAEFQKKITCCNDKEVVKTNDQGLVEFFQTNKIPKFLDFFNQLPPVSSNSLFLDIGTAPKILITNANKAYVVVNIKSQEHYLSNYYLVQNLIDDLIVDNIKISTIPKIGLVSSGDSQFFLSEFMGYDYETEIIENKKFCLKAELKTISTQIESNFRKKGIFFRNLAPRNLVHGDKNTCYIIDFDNVYKIDQINDYVFYSKELNRKVWFADLFNKQEIETIFKSPIYSCDILVDTKDAFEINFFRKDKITIKEIHHLYDLICDFEKYDKYKFLNVYGHQLGRFISDFWPQEMEIQMYKYIEFKSNKVREIRAILYLISRIDQELLLRQKYGLNTGLCMLSNLFFAGIEKNLWPSFEKVKSIVNSSLNFSQKYNHLLPLV